MNKFGKEGIINRLAQLDDDLLSKATGNEKVEITIIGGSALVLLGLSSDSRITTDIDVLETMQEAEELLEQYDMNQHTATFLYKLPENWRNRRQRVPFEGAILEIYSPSNEDIAILKLIANRPVDQYDIKEMLQSGGLDIDKLMAIVADDIEVRFSFDNDEEWQVFLKQVNELVVLSKTTEDTK